MIRWVDTATHTPTTPPHWVLRQAKRVGLGWPGRCRRAGSPAGTKRDGARLEWASRFSLLRKSLCGGTDPLRLNRITRKQLQRWPARSWHWSLRICCSSGAWHLILPCPSRGSCFGHFVRSTRLIAKDCCRAQPRTRDVRRRPQLTAVMFRRLNKHPHSCLDPVSY